ncbi:MAG: DNA mismatch repair endonuclease MutL [Acidobacteriota bacterium]
MGKVHLLESPVVDRIAAGEVVERPASVVKELIENALDAGAARVDVQVVNGGASLIEVTDDGHGMEAEDAELAFSQHATSKIARLEDLDAIGTLGFRGEALASIASVARVELSSGTGEGVGTRLIIEGGQMSSQKAVPWPRGTTVRVADLFFNTPARRKHLRTRSTEFSHIAHTVLDYALARPDVFFSLSHGKRSSVSAPAVATLRERVHQLLGDQVASCWLPVEQATGQLRVSGGVTSPQQQRPNRRHVRWYVNGRPVSDYRLTHALVHAYETLLDSGRYPVTALFLEMPLGEVDVNVHPRKAEVRFTYASQIYRAVRSAVRASLARHLPPAMVTARSLQPGPIGSGAAAAGGQQVDASGRQEARHSMLPLREWVVAEGTEVAHSGTAELVIGGVAGVDEATAAGEGAVGISGTEGPVQPLAQYANTYILAADARGLLIIDQHVAHERILYEQILAQMAGQRLEAQHLLVPETLELSAAEAAVVAEQEELLARFGFALEPFGGDSWAVRTAPAILATRRLAPTLLSLLDSLGAGTGPEALEQVQRGAAATISCHAAVRAHHPLTQEEMVRLVSDLSRCAAPTRCPHGRPILLRVEHQELERRLGRR